MRKTEPPSFSHEGMKLKERHERKEERGMERREREGEKRERKGEKRERKGEKRETEREERMDLLEKLNKRGRDRATIILTKE
jgi:hypothetical protein